MLGRLRDAPCFLGGSVEGGGGSKLAKCAVLDFLQYFDNTQTMETLNAAERLAALGHESRLAIFRLLVEAGPEGVNASAIGEQLGMAPATLSFHLAHLSRVGLIAGERESRFIRYSANYGAMDELIAFLTHNCCQGKACLSQSTCCDTSVTPISSAGKPV